MRTLFALLLLLTLPTQPAANEDPLAQLTGIWRLAEFAVEWTDTGERTYWVKDRPDVHMVITPTGWFSVIVTTHRRKATERVERSGTGLRTLIPYNGPLTVEGNLLIIRVHGATEEDLIGTDQVREFALPNRDQVILRTLPKPAYDSVERRVRSVLVWHRER